MVLPLLAVAAHLLFGKIGTTVMATTIGTVLGGVVKDQTEGLIPSGDARITYFVQDYLNEREMGTMTAQKRVDLVNHVSNELGMKHEQVEMTFRIADYKYDKKAQEGVVRGIRDVVDDIDTEQDKLFFTEMAKAESMFKDVQGRAVKTDAELSDIVFDETELYIKQTKDYYNSLLYRIDGKLYLVQSAVS